MTSPTRDLAHSRLSDPISYWRRFETTARVTSAAQCRLQVAQGKAIDGRKSVRHRNHLVPGTAVGSLWPGPHPAVKMQTQDRKVPPLSSLGNSVAHALSAGLEVMQLFRAHVRSMTVCSRFSRFQGTHSHLLLPEKRSALLCKGVATNPKDKDGESS